MNHDIEITFERNGFLDIEQLLINVNRGAVRSGLVL